MGREKHRIGALFVRTPELIFSQEPQAMDASDSKDASGTNVVLVSMEGTCIVLEWCGLTLQPRHLCLPHCLRVYVWVFVRGHVSCGTRHCVVCVASATSPGDRFEVPLKVAQMSDLVKTMVDPEEIGVLAVVASLSVDSLVHWPS